VGHSVFRSSISRTLRSKHHLTDHLEDTRASFTSEAFKGTYETSYIPISSLKNSDVSVAVLLHLNRTLMFTRCSTVIKTAVGELVKLGTNSRR